MSKTSAKVAILTGAASGMGEALARDLVSKDWHVACLDVQKQAGEALVAELGNNCIFIQCDIADYDQQAKACTEVWDKYGRLDALLANAGIVDKSSIYILDWRGKDEIPPKPNTACTDIDYKAILYGVQLAIHFMRKNPTPGGQIIATSSIAAVVNLALCIEPILRMKENISINVVLPGIVPTKIIPQSMIDAVSSECLTPASTIVSAYNHFLDNPTVSGQVVECSTDKHFFLPRPELANGRFTKRAITVWDPLFKMLHHEGSGLPDAIP
ncbi:15-hydroxyprostaglandin dehydrogenase [Exophiala viscosa]|uniref:15-hydroxyprostaglandin dehydrogenase n=1 Tax=Exophiala viscosa TaxID=2486360 RepID=UPI00219A208C|nr:15-hydroxyprostaglandin dehydrogenase [Exophiala viscosa]